MADKFQVTRLDTTLEVDYTGEDTVRVRYLDPVVSDWFKEEYHLSDMYAAGWRKVVGNGGGE